MLLFAQTEALHAQEVPDTTRAARTDTTAIVPPRRGTVAAQRPPMEFPGIGVGDAIVDTIPARLPVLDATGILSRVPGSFVYEFGTPGWPEGWSLYGYRPGRIALTFQQLPFNDLISGRPRYDLLPLAFLEPLRLEATRYGAPAGVLASLRAYDGPRPLTELRYWTGANGLQSIEAMHTQSRAIAPFGKQGVLSLLAGYGGKASQGEYPGSRLRRERRLTGRLRFARPNWTLEIIDLYNRRRIGAHGGVEDPIFQRIGASVIHPNARRQTIRNDLSGTLRARLLGMVSPATLTAFWTSQSLLYDRDANSVDGDTVLVSADRVGARLNQDWRFRSHRVGVELAGWLDTWNTQVPVDAGYREQWQFHATARDSLALGGSSLRLEGGIHRDGSRLYPSSSARFTRPIGAGQFYVSGRLAGQPLSGAERFGFGPVLLAEGDPDVSRTLQADAGLQLRGQIFDASVAVFANHTARTLDMYIVAEDTARVFVTDEPIRRLGVTLDLGWRRRAERGLYATAQSTFLQYAGDDEAEGHVPISESLPSLYGNGRFGARYLLFRGDLDLDLFLDGRFWSEMRSRTLHPPTGLLALPADDARVVGPSGVLNVVIQAGVRTATFFIAWDNVLASSTGGGLYEGVLLVPDYPLPERRFRFGVYWPIQD